MYSLSVWLKLSIHGDAFRTDPVAYVTALWWRLCGKRVRSRHQFARLLGGSRYAYDLWRHWHEEDAPVGAELAGARDLPPIVALIDSLDAEPEAIAETLLSLSREGISALVIGVDGIATLADACPRIDWEVRPLLMPMAAGDRFATGGARAYRMAFAGSDTNIAYADDDLVDASGHRMAPHFKPDWNGELFRHFDYLTGACVLRCSADDLSSVVGERDWARRIVELKARNGSPLHIRKFLHHRRTRPSPHVPAAPFVTREDWPLVTVIVPTRNRVDLLRTCLNGVAATDYSKIEVVVVDNGSDDPETLEYLHGLDPVRHRVLQHDGVFNFSTINNRAAAIANGDLLCLLNNDIEVINPSWLKIMVMQAMREDVGAVGARLLYPDGRMQHAGVVTGMGNAAGHAHRFLYPDDEGYFRRHALPQFASAVTAACLVVARERFLAVAGLDEDNFAVAFNDVDLCLRLNQRGWQSLYEPRATLIHHESVSRGLDRDPIGAERFARELAALKRLWRTDELFDPYHHPELSRASEHFVVRL